jgi:hypothetical protein
MIDRVDFLKLSPEKGCRVRELGEEWTHHDRAPGKASIFPDCQVQFGRGREHRISVDTPTGTKEVRLPRVTTPISVWRDRAQLADICSRTPSALRARANPGPGASAAPLLLAPNSQFHLVLPQPPRTVCTNQRGPRATGSLAVSPARSHLGIQEEAGKEKKRCFHQLHPGHPAVITRKRTAKDTRGIRKWILSCHRTERAGGSTQ